MHTDLYDEWPQEELHQLCGHCHQWLTLPVYKRHRMNFYHTESNTWQQAEELVSSESDTDQNWEPLDTQQPIIESDELKGTCQLHVCNCVRVNFRQSPWC